jgi:hypothetical protein
MEAAPRLATRFGKSYHRSYVRMKLQQLRGRDPTPMQSFEEWLVQVAETRANKVHSPPSVATAPNEELIVGLLLLENLDCPGLLKSAALMLSRLRIDQKELTRLAKQECVDFLLSALKGCLSKIEPTAISQRDLTLATSY